MLPDGVAANLHKMACKHSRSSTSGVSWVDFSKDQVLDYVKARYNYFSGARVSQRYKKVSLVGCSQEDTKAEKEVA